MPVGAFGGKKEIMAMVAPEGPVYQAGTLSGNPLAMVCGYTLLKELHENPSLYQDMDEKAAYLETGLHTLFRAKGLKYTINRVQSMISFHFEVDEVKNFDHACAANADTFKKVFHTCLDNGVYLAPSAFETLFIAHSHTYEQLDQTIEAIAKAL